ncbi:hypothetical protein [Pulveribacter sp.]|uniref:hypothetical protein n=1 Tax=Pulveribacter sp. TaxID=2678893 RepID=UPI0028A942EC|nr:hypothetical protein [Pulveribacter sp.]
MSKLQERLQYERTTGARLLLMWAALLWAASLMLPTETMARPTYRLMADLMGERQWIALLLAYSLGLCLPYQATLRRWLLMIGGHVMGMVLWGTISVCMLATNGLPSAAVMPNLALALVSAWVLWNAPRCPKKDGEAGHGF